MSQGVDPPPESPVTIHVDQLTIEQGLADAQRIRDARVSRLQRKYAGVEHDNATKGADDARPAQPTRRTDRW